MTNPIIPVFDGHNDLPWESRDNRHYSVEGIDQELPQTLHTDIPKLRRGRLPRAILVGVRAQRLRRRRRGDRHARADRLRAPHVRALPRDLQLATTADDVRAAQDEGRIASLIGIEGGHQIANNMAVLREYARLGVRYMTLTWNNATNSPTRRSESTSGTA